MVIIKNWTTLIFQTCKLGLPHTRLQEAERNDQDGPD